MFKNRAAVGSILMHRFKRAATKEQTIHNSRPMIPKQRKNNGYFLVNQYSKTEPSNVSSEYKNTRSILENKTKHVLSWESEQKLKLWGEDTSIQEKQAMPYLSILYIKNTNEECFIGIYNIDKTLRALWLVKNLCFIRV